jgi:hypothetical protein
MLNKDLKLNSKVFNDDTFDPLSASSGKIKL